ncbi:zinc finger CCCH domain-containing protein 62-like isoform X2 [Chenopodium quinoa]|uniref:zinc finger CCCH domain-containing protein 62-like isoform X2 n=1 Tax=Chenopodium quinoa TaxID=63459 RepID=UPI000B799E74|nr:zinc finger CCCH domain-containing protein 62-like isoform X2 [Chenopodium quinoa]
MTSNKGKNFLINLSSSSSSDDNGDDDDTASDSASSSSGDECELIDDDDDYEIEDDESEEDDCLKDDFRGTEDDDHCLSNRVIQFLQGRRDLQELSLKACKAYLRRHDLRLSGNKDECIRRVQEHHRIKDGKAEILYPSSSFVINCTGDVCKGDTVLFKQKVYGRSFDKVTRQGKLLGKRTVAGRVVKESYGAAKQQHTFTVEVLWSKGIKKLPSLFPLLVKGRNLYRLKTCRQPWKNEGERRKVLAEKHRRGTAARYKRAKRKNALSTDKGACFMSSPIVEMHGSWTLHIYRAYV